MPLSCIWCAKCTSDEQELLTQTHTLTNHSLQNPLQIIAGPMPDKKLAPRPLLIHNTFSAGSPNAIAAKYLLLS